MESLCRGELVKQLYRLGVQAASGVLKVNEQVFVLRRGGVIVGEGDLAKRTLAARLVRLVAHERCTLLFEGGVPAYPPGPQQQVMLASWARAHLEQQLDGALADTVIRDLAGARLSIRPELQPQCEDETDRRMLAAMVQPRRLDQIWPLARTPRFRLLSFIHFLRGVDALLVEGVVTTSRGENREDHARRLLGVERGADGEAVKRAYRRLARSLHPDLQPNADEDRRRSLERRFAEVTAAYESLTGVS